MDYEQQVTDNRPTFVPRQQDYGGQATNHAQHTTHNRPDTDTATRSIVLYDGLCNLCSGSVRFIIRRDPKKRFAFAALQSETGRKLLDRHGLPADSMETFVLIDENRAFVRSDAWLRIARRLSGLWPLFGAFIVIPRPIRDWCYGFIARRRYEWFGKRDVCMLSAPESPDRFLE